MVGVPGRSKACHNCKRRHIACSAEPKPCLQCRKAGIHCEGYLRETIFIEYSSENPTSSYNASLAPRPQKPRQRKSHSRPGNAVAFPRLNAPSPSPLQRIQLFSCMLPYCTPLTTASVAFDVAWLDQISSPASSSEAFERATFAVCLAKIGRLESDDALVRQSFAHYSASLMTLRHLLQDPVRVLEDHTLGICAASVIYEILECPNGREVYLMHLEGCARLIQLRGPDSTRQGLAHNIFLMHRLQYFLESLARRKPAYFAERQWVQESSLTAKDAFEVLLDLAAPAVALFQEGEALKGLSISDLPGATRALVGRCLALDDEFERFQERYELGTYSRYLKPSSSGVTGTSSLEEVLGARLKHGSISDLRQARTVMFLWAMQALLWSGLEQLYAGYAKLQDFILQAMPEASAKPCETLPELGHRADWISAARKVCHLSSLSTAEVDAAIAAWAVAAPLAVVVGVLEHYPDYQAELDWSRSILVTLGRRGPAIFRSS